MNHTELPADWDKTIARLGGPFLQTSTWAKFQESLGREVAFAQGQDWAWLAAVRHGRGVDYLYAAYGPVAKSAVQPAFESLVAAATERKLDFVRIEPWGSVSEADLKQAGWERVADTQPQYMLELDLTPDLETLRKGVTQSNRNLINQANARGLSFRITENANDIAAFNLIHNATAAYGNFKNHGDAYYTELVHVLLEQQVGRLYFVDFEDQPVAAAICYDWNGTRYYAFAGADPEKNRELKAAVALVWWLICDAKEKGLKTFNYGGIAPEGQPNHPWAGHTRFKRSIGGETVQTIGTWEKPLKTAKYGLYKLAKRVLPR